LTNKLHYDHPVGYAHNASVYTRKAYDAIGGYESVSLGADARMDGALLTMEHVVDPQRRGSTPLTKNEWFYVYRWGVSPVHISSMADTDDGRYVIAGQVPVTPGTFNLRPHWRTNYLEMTRNLLAEIESTPA
jgi:hypothetical protein